MKKTSYTPEERADIMERYEANLASGMTARVAGVKAGVDPKTVYFWHWKKRHQPEVWARLATPTNGNGKSRLTLDTGIDETTATPASPCTVASILGEIAELSRHDMLILFRAFQLALSTADKISNR